MTDVLEFNPLANGQWIFALDGRVLEIFGPIEPPWNLNTLVYVDSWRSRHAADGHGYRPGQEGVPRDCVQDAGREQSQSPERHGLMAFSKLDDMQRNLFQPLLDALTNATGDTAAGSASNALLATKTSAFQALLSQYGGLSTQPEDVRSAVVSGLQAAGISIDPDSLAMRLADAGQVDTAVEIYKRHSLLPPHASTG